MKNPSTAFAEITQNIAGIVRVADVETLEIDETDGKATIAKAKNTFPGGIDPDFKENSCDVESEPTKKTQVSVHILIKNGNFVQIFSGINDDLNRLCFKQSQIIQFVQKHRKWIHRYGTFFLFKVGDEFFVADVYLDNDGYPMVTRSSFSRALVWLAPYRLRIVTPQLSLANKP